MRVEQYLSSGEFLHFQDENLRDHACGLVDQYLKENDPVDKSQLHAIPAAIQAGGFRELGRLVDQQRSKNTKQKNQAFWNFLFVNIMKQPGDEGSLPALLRAKLVEKGLLEDESGAQERAERNRIKKENKAAMETFFNGLLEEYFEHFNCHYFYRRSGQR